MVYSIPHKHNICTSLLYDSARGKCVLHVYVADRVLPPNTSLSHFLSSLLFEHLSFCPSWSIEGEILPPKGGSAILSQNWTHPFLCEKWSYVAFRAPTTPFALALSGSAPEPGDTGAWIVLPGIGVAVPRAPLKSCSEHSAPGAQGVCSDRTVSSKPCATGTSHLGRLPAGGEVCDRRILFGRGCSRVLKLHFLLQGSDFSPSSCAKQYLDDSANERFRIDVMLMVELLHRSCLAKVDHP